MLMTEIEVTEIEVPREKKYAKTRQCIKLEKDAPPSMYSGCTMRGKHSMRGFMLFERKKN